ncbi:MAG: histidine phosphatase family protein [Pseudomonadota bacterium]
MTQLLLARHGETDWNRELRFQGQLDVPLNEAGRLQAQRLAERLGLEAVDHIVSSDLLRARQTAQACAERLGLALHSDAGLREQSFGMLEGLSAQQVRRSHPEVWADWSRHDADYAVPGGESTRAFAGRVLQAVQRLAQAHAGRTLLVVTHGGTLDMLWRVARAAPLHGPRTCAIPNCGISRMRCIGERLLILHWADEAHLQGLPAQPSTVPASVQLAAR